MRSIIRRIVATAATSALGLLGAVTLSTPAHAAESCQSAGYYLVSVPFDLKDKKGKKSSVHQLNLYKKKGTDKYAIEARADEWVNPKRTYYASVAKLYSNGSKGKKKADRGYGQGGTKCVEFTMHTDGQRFLLYGSRAAKKGAKPTHTRWITVWRGDSGGVHWAG